MAAVNARSAVTSGKPASRLIPPDRSIVFPYDAAAGAPAP